MGLRKGASAGFEASPGPAPGIRTGRLIETAAAGAEQFPAFCPNAVEAAMLKAAFAEPDCARERWDQLEPTLDLDALPPDAYRVLPLLYRRLSRAGVRSEALRRLGGIYRHTWAKNQMLVHELDELLIMAGVGVHQVLALLGLALILRPGADAGVRPVAHAELCVTPGAYERLLGALGDGQWTTRAPAASGTTGTPMTFEAFRRGTRIGVSAAASPAWNWLWDRARSLRLTASCLQIPSPEAQLAHLYLERTAGSGELTVGWAADCACILTDHPGAFDLTRLGMPHSQLGVEEALIQALVSLSGLLDLGFRTAPSAVELSPRRCEPRPPD